MKKRLVFILTIAGLLILAACAKAECKTDADCTRQYFTARCEDKKCIDTPIPNECGNSLCEPPENPCNCPEDCKPPCTGKVPNTKYLVQQCVQDQCVESVPPEQVKPIYSSADQTSAGDKFKIDTIYNQPFNMKKDTFGIMLALMQQAPQNKDEKILNAELTATTKDGRTITLGRINIDKNIWQGGVIKEEIILDFPTAELEGELTNLLMKIQYEYSVLQAGKKTPRQATMQNRYREKFTFVRPTASYPCPASCDDQNPGTRDYCGPQTNYFCMHEPIPNVCGNFKCEGAETKCSCPQDCGPCAGSAGNFLDYTCQGTQCTTILKSGVSVQPNSLFDDRSLGPVRLNNNYKFNNPFNIKEDKFALEFKIYQIDPTASDMTIETVRMLEGQQQIAEVQPNQKLSATPTTVEITIPSIVDPEEEHTLTLGIWYKYVAGGEEKRGSFQKPLGKITLINPG